MTASRGLAERRAQFRPALAILALALGVVALLHPSVLAGVALPNADVATNHWAFQPIRPSPPPTNTGSTWPRTDIDRFILARLNAKDLPPARPANRRDLLRRATFDLTGLPPTAAEIAAFEYDTTTNAFDRCVDRLLASPHYGERWGRWWLDVARYADTNGQDENKVMANAWRYRDWVIRSFNANLPVDRFVLHQIAGDLLPPADSEAEQADRLTATGFLVLGPKMLAEQDKPKLVMDLVDEQIDTVGRTFLGLTLGCARCHDHKFDPVSARDYYAMAGIFKSTRTMENLDFVSKFNERMVATMAEVAAYDAHRKRLGELTNRLAAAIQSANTNLLASWRDALPRHLAAAVDPGLSPPAPDLHSNLLQRLRALVSPDPTTNRLSADLRALAAEPARLSLLLAESALPSGSPSDPGVRLVPGRLGAAFHAAGSDYLELPSIPALEPAQLTVETWVRAASFPKGGEPRRWLISKNGNEWIEGHYALVLDGPRAGAYLNIGGGKDNTHAVWSDAGALRTNRWHHLTFTYDGAVLRLFVDGQPAGTTSIQRPRVPGTGPLALGRRQDGHVHFVGDLDEARVFDRALAPDEIRQHFEHPETSPSAAPVARWEFNDLSTPQNEFLAGAAVRLALLGPGGVVSLPADPRPAYPATVRDALVDLEKQRDALLASAPPPPAMALAVTDGKPVDLPVHLRGNHLSPAKDPVPRGFIEVVARANPAPAIPSDHSGRQELGHWLVAPANPLTARVLVNRVWQAHFSEGLVRSSDNFGLRGELPSHPELLDWLADHFVRSGWDLKALHRLILSSAVYQQASSRDAPDDVAGVRTETVDPENRLLHRFPRRRLDAEMIRDAVLAVSDRLDPAVGGSLVDWKNNEYAPGDEVSAKSLRRSVYLPIVRDRTYDALLLFDFANPSVTTATRTSTIVSQQALFFLNSPLLKDSAATLAGRLAARSDLDVPARIRWAFQKILGRPPEPAELARCELFLAEDHDDSPQPGADGAHPTSGLEALCQTLLSANEFVYRP